MRWHRETLQESCPRIAVHGAHAFRRRAVSHGTMLLGAARAACDTKKSGVPVFAATPQADTAQTVDVHGLGAQQGVRFQPLADHVESVGLFHSHLMSSHPHRCRSFIGDEQAFARLGEGDEGEGGSVCVTKCVTLEGCRWAASWS